MIKAFKTEIKPTQDQIIKIHKTIGTCRFLYNQYIADNKEMYEKYKDGEMEYGFIRGFDFDKYVNNVLSKQPGYEWIKDVSGKARKKAIMNGDKAFHEFFEGKKGFPQFKKKKDQDVKAYFVKNNKTDFSVERHRIKVPTLKWVRLKEKGYIPIKANIKSCTISQKADRYYISVIVEMPDIPVNQNNDGDGLGIDLGIKSLAVISNNLVFGNINKNSQIRKLKKQLRREQRKLSRKYEALKKRGKNASRQNIKQQILKIQKLHKKIHDIRVDYINKVVSSLVKTKPHYITIEDLNVKGMLKNKHLSAAIAEQLFGYFIVVLQHKCQENVIELRQVNRFYPSSRICSQCKSIKNDLKLGDRVFKCLCGLEMDRDKNASINLKEAKEYRIVA